MPPKKPAQATSGSKKTQEKKKEKIIEVKFAAFSIQHVELRALCSNSLSSEFQQLVM